MASYSDIRRVFLDRLSHIYSDAESHELFLMSLEHATGYDRLRYGLHAQVEVPADIEEKLTGALGALERHVPIQHVVGKAAFYGLTFEVDKYTLIPRPETEELVDLIIGDSPRDKRLNILDIGTGTGCIAIALAKNLPDSGVYAVDISEEALGVAQRNAERNSSDVSFSLLDITRWRDRKMPNKGFDVIVSNPPYIRHSEREAMARNVVDHEPHTALFVTDDDPLLFYAHICDFATQYLCEGGYLYFEINQYLAPQTCRLLHEKGFLDITLVEDINGANRILRARN